MTLRHFKIVREDFRDTGKIRYIAYSRPRDNYIIEDDKSNVEAKLDVIYIKGIYLVLSGGKLQNFEPTTQEKQACKFAYDGVVSAVKRIMYPGDTIEDKVGRDTFEDKVSKFEQRDLFESINL